MTSSDFLAYCLDNTLNPEDVFENEKVRKALKDKDDLLVIKLIQTEF